MKKLLIIVLVVAVGVFSWYKLSIRPVDSGSDDRKAVKIESGMSVRSIAEHLDSLNLIRSPRAFMIFTKLHGAEKNLEAGKFVIRPSMNISEIVEVLKHGIAEEMIVTIPEGYSVKDIDRLLAEKGIIELGEIIKCASECDFETFTFLPELTGLASRGGRLEGYLFPETYYVDVEEFVPKFFIERMLNTFRKKVLETFPEEFKDGNRSIHDVVTMASLIEKEAKKDEERPMISGILWKRFDEGMGLGVDATVRYIIDKPTGAITVADLNTNSPYNTRKFKGLPPGPIANAGVKSIRAALFPEASEYWYYLHGDDGTIHYAKTNNQHNLNRIDYIK